MKDSELVQKLLGILEPGQCLTDRGRCYRCEQIKPTEGENHPFFIDGNFVCKECYCSELGEEVEKYPIVSSRVMALASRHKQNSSLDLYK